MHRSDLLATLLETHEGATSGNSSLVLLSGPAGMGKSWLAEKFRQQLDGFAPLVRGGPLLPSLLRTAYPVLHQDRDAALQQVLLALRPGGPWQDRKLSEATALQPDRAPLDLADALGRAARRQAGMCLIFEDAHAWRAEDLRGFGRFWLRLLSSRAPVMTVVTSREAETDWWASLRRDTLAFGGTEPKQLKLERLNSEAQSQLTGSFLHGLSYPKELDTWLAQRAQGHPLHQLELLRFLLQGGSLLRGEITWKLRLPPDELLPQDLTELLGSRLAAQPPGNVLRLLQLLALLDRSVAADEAARMLRLSPHELQQLAQTGAPGLLHSQLENGVTTFSLDHPLLLPEVRRRMSGQETAEVRAAIVAGTPLMSEKARHGRLLHLEEALEWTRQALSEALAGDQSAAVVEACEALLPTASGEERERLLLLATQRCQRLGEPHRALRFTEDTQSRELLELRMELLSNLGQYGDALEVAALLRSRHPGENLFPVRKQEVYFLVQLGRLQEADDLAGELLLSDELGEAGRAGVLVRRAHASKYLQSYHAAYAMVSEAAGILEAVAPGSRELLVALGNQAGLGALSGDWTASHQALTNATRLAEELVLPQYLPMLLGNRAFLLWVSGEYKEAESALLACMRLAEERDMGYIKAINLWNYGRWLLSSGQPAAAVAVLRESLALGGASGPDLAEALALSGEFDEAVTQLDGVINEPNCWSHPHSRTVVWLCGGKAHEALAELGQHDPATAHPAHAARHCLLRLVARSLLGNAPPDKALLQEARSLLEQGPHEPLAAELQLADALLVSSDVAAGREALARLAELGATGHALLYERLFPQRFEALLPTEPPAAAAARPVFISVLGGLELGDTRWRGRQARDLLAHLLTRRLGGRTPVRRQDLLLSLWPDSEPERAATNLRVTMQRLRRAMGAPAEILRNAHDEFELHGVVTDAELFSRAAAEGDPEHALTWYAGPFLPNFDHPDAAFLRDRFGNTYRECLLRLAAGPPSELAREHLKRALSADPLDLELIEALVSQLRDRPTERLRLLQESSAAYQFELGEVPEELRQLN